MKKIPTLLLFALLVGILFSCGGNELKPEVGEKVTETTTEASKEIDIEYIDLEGYEIRFLINGDTKSSFYNFDLYAETINGDVINDAIFERNSYLEEKYNFKIKRLESGTAQPVNVVRTSILAQENSYDVVYEALNYATTLIQEKMLVDLYTLPYVDFSKPYWDSGVNNDLSIGRKLYTTHGEHMLSVSAGLYGTFFNKELAEEVNLENLYDVVRANKWTMEKYYSLAKDVTYDFNGDGILDYEDVWGLVSETFNSITFFTGSGEKITSKDNDDLPVLAMNNPRAESVLNLSSEFLSDKNTTILFEYYGQDKWPLLTKIWEEGRALFFLGPLLQTPKFRNMDTDFGILPAPKFEESQERYYHLVSLWGSPLFCVPITITEYEKIGYILEILAAKSVDTLIPAFYEVQLTNKLIRDNESKDMIEIMLASASFDLGSAYDFGGLMRAILSIGSDSKVSFASRYA